MCPYRHLRTYGLASILVVALPLTGGCGTEYDGNGGVDGEAGVAAAQSLTAISGASCVQGMKLLACASPAVLMDCTIQTKNTLPATATCCLRSGSSVAGMSCTPRADAGRGGVLRPNDDPPELTR